MSYIIPAILLLIFFTAARRGVPCYNAFLEGAQDGMKTLVSILPPLVAILSASAMLTESGAISALCKFVSPVTSKIGIPEEIMPLALLRPLSGSGSIALISDMLAQYGAKSTIALAACILCASTETTFYTISVYFAPTAAVDTKRVIFAAIIGDVAGILCASRLSAIFF